MANAEDMMEHRKIERLDVGGTIVCRVDGAESHDELGDMSVRGCRLIGVGESLNKGTEVDLTLLSGVCVRGTVRWVADGDAGVEFAEPVNMATVRYFTLAKLAISDEDVTLDSFGRRLPPLQQIDSDFRKRD